MSQMARCRGMRYWAMYSSSSCSSQSSSLSAGNMRSWLAQRYAGNHRSRARGGVTSRCLQPHCTAPALQRQGSQPATSLCNCPLHCVILGSAQAGGQMPDLVTLEGLSCRWLVLQQHQGSWSTTRSNANATGASQGPGSLARSPTLYRWLPLCWPQWTSMPTSIPKRWLACWVGQSMSNSASYGERLCACLCP